MSMQPSAERLSGKMIAGMLTAMFLATLGVDFLFHAGLLARYYRHPGPALLPVPQLIRRIPFGYASMLLTLAFELWLICRVGLRGTKAGAGFGAIFGLVLGVAGAIGLFSLVPLGVDYLASVAVCQVIEYAIAGALAGSAMKSGRSLRVAMIGAAILLAGVAGGLAMQAADAARGRAGSM